MTNRLAAIPIVRHGTSRRVSTLRRRTAKTASRTRAATPATSATGIPVTSSGSSTATTTAAMSSRRRSGMVVVSVSSYRPTRLLRWMRVSARTVLGTAVVSKDMNAVLTVTMARTNTHSSARRPRPPDGQAFGDDGEHSCDAGELGDDRHGDDEDEDGSSRLREPHQVLARQTTGGDREDRDHGTMMFHRREVGFHWLSRTPAGYGTPIAARFDREPSSPRSASTGSLGLAHERRMPPQPDPQVSGLEHAEREREA